MLKNIGQSKLVHCVKDFRIRSYSGPYSVQMRENTDQNNSECGHASRSGTLVYFTQWDGFLTKWHKHFDFYCHTSSQFSSRIFFIKHFNSKTTKNTRVFYKNIPLSNTARFHSSKNPQWKTHSCFVL